MGPGRAKRIVPGDCGRSRSNNYRSNIYEKIAYRVCARGFGPDRRSTARWLHGARCFFFKLARFLLGQSWHENCIAKNRPFYRAIIYSFLIFTITSRGGQVPQLKRSFLTNSPKSRFCHASRFLSSNLIVLYFESGKCHKYSNSLSRGIV